jgi:hypothetical protein
MSTPLKWTVPVDGQAHPIGGGKPILTACQNGPDAVQVWTDEPAVPSARESQRAAIVVATGQTAPGGWKHIGSSVASYTPPLVWHVYVGNRWEGS